MVRLCPSLVCCGDANAIGQGFVIACYDHNVWTFRIIHYSLWVSDLYGISWLSPQWPAWSWDSRETPEGCLQSTTTWSAERRSTEPAHADLTQSQPQDRFGWSWQLDNNYKLYCPVVYQHQYYCCTWGNTLLDSFRL